MYISDQILFLELQKTGGSHIRKLLSEWDSSGRFTGMHDRLEVLPDYKKVLSSSPLIIGSIRNPLSWYVSLWAYGCGKEGDIYYRTATWWWRYILSDLRALTTPRTQWRKCYADANDPEGFRSWLKMILKSDYRINIGEGYDDSPLSKEIGFFTYRYFNLFSKGNRKRWENTMDAEEYFRLSEAEFVPSILIQMEDLTENLIQTLESKGIQLTDEVKAKWRSMDRTNASKHRPYEDYYDDECRELVMRRDFYLVNKYYSAIGG